MRTYLSIDFVALSRSISMVIMDACVVADQFFSSIFAQFNGVMSTCRASFFSLLSFRCAQPRRLLSAFSNRYLSLDSNL